MLKEIPKNRNLHPDLVSITQEMVDIYPKGHNDGKVRIKFYNLLKKRSELILSLMKRGECDEEGLVPAKSSIDSTGVYNSLLTVLKDEEQAMCYTIDIVWEAGKSPHSFKKSVLEVMRKALRGQYPKLTDQDKILLQEVLLNGDPNDSLEDVCEQVYQASKAHHAQTN